MRAYRCSPKLWVTLLLLLPPLRFAFFVQKSSRRHANHHETANDSNGESLDRPSAISYLDLETWKYDHHSKSFTRRRVIETFIGCCSLHMATTAANARDSVLLANSETAKISRAISDELVSSLTYQKVLGQGSYKNVYLVASDSSSQDAYKWALAVEKIRSKKDAKNGLRGIRMAEELQGLLAKSGGCQDCFERVERWWFQSTALPEFQPNICVFPSSTTTDGQDRTQATPRKFLGRSKWLVALKPVYDMDLRRLAEKAPTLYPIGSTSRIPTNSSRILAGVDLDNVDTSALRLAYGLCETGRLMHSLGFIHRDIKPKNIMLHQGGRPVIIDFGFSVFVKPARNDGRLCIEEPGKIKGETGYILSADAARYQSCAEGDEYAMGKTLYEVIFGGDTRENASSLSSSSSSSSSSSPSSSSAKMSLEAIKAQETKFRKLLSSDQAGTKSRFLLTENGRETLMRVIRGLCQEQNPVSFGEAAEYLKKEAKMDTSVL